MPAGSLTMTRTYLRTSKIALSSWLIGLVFFFSLTALAVVDQYDTAEEIAAYVQTVGSAPATLLMNGKIFGLDTTGGIVANEFGMLSGLLIPLMGAALMSRLTRKDEEAGRWELLLSSPLSRLAPMTAAWVIVTSALALLGLGFWAVMLGSDVPIQAATWYALAQVANGLVYAAVAFVFANLLENSRSVLGATLAVITVTYLIRGLGAINDNALMWASPLGWADHVRPFDNPQGWPLLLHLATTIALIGLGLAVYRRRDTGGALWHARPGRAHARPILRHQLGLAGYLHRGNLIGWLLGVGVFMMIYGSVTQTILDAIAATPGMEDFFATSDGTSLLDAVFASFLMMLAFLVSAYAINASGTMNTTEQRGWLEAELAGPKARTGWWAAHAFTITVGTLAIWAIGTAALAYSSAAVLEDSSIVGHLFEAATGYLPAILLTMTLPWFMFGLGKNKMWIAWLVFGVSAAIGLFGPMLQLSDDLVGNSLFLIAGQQPMEDINYAAVAGLLGLAVALGGTGWWRFTQRDVS